MRVLLRDLAPGQEYAIQFRSNNGAEASEWSQVSRFTTTDDQLPPSPVLNLTWYDSGPSFIAQWDKVETNADGSPMKDFRYYRINVTDGITDEDFFVLRERFELTREMNAAAFGDFRSALSIMVYAVDMTYNESTPATKSVDPAAPPVPTAPHLEPYYGSVLLTYDGRDTSGAIMPTNIDYIEIHIGDTVGFTPDDTTYNSRMILNRSSQEQRALLAGLENGETYYAKLVAVDVLQKRSNPSAVSNATTKTNLTGLDIEDGQISTAEINFTAKDIGGANAYFPATIAARDAITTAVDGDIAYVTGIGYHTFRFNGTTWIEAPEVGVIAGTKILAGTLTADAVGTNLIISAKANIGEAIIDSSHIDQLNANVITAGSLQSTFTVNYAGEAVPRPAWKLDVNGNLLINNAEIKGQLVIGDANNTTNQNAQFAIRSFNYIQGLQGWTINGDGTVEFASGTFRGTLQTATTGDRVVIGSSPDGRFGGIDLYDFTNRRVFFTTATLATQDPSGNPALILGFDDPFNWPGKVSNGHPPNAFHMVKNGDAILQIGGTLTLAAPNGFSVRGGEFSGANMLNWSATASNLYGPQASHRFNLDSAGNFYFYTPGSTGSIRILNQGNATYSPALQWFNQSGYGIKIHLINDSRGQFLETQWWNGGGWSGFRASVYEVASDERLKADVTTAETASMLAQINKTRVTKYKLKQPNEIVMPKSTAGAKLAATETNGEATAVEIVDTVVPAPTTATPEQIGLIAQEAPAQIVSIAPDGNSQFIDLYQMLTMVWGAVQELSKTAEALNVRITALEPKGKTK